MTPARPLGVVTFQGLFLHFDRYLGLSFSVLLERSRVQVFRRTATVHAEPSQSCCDLISRSNPKLEHPLDDEVRLLQRESGLLLTLLVTCVRDTHTHGV